MIRIGDLTLDLDAKLVQIGETPVHLTGREYQMVELLALRRGKTLTKELFLTSLYGGQDEPEPKIIDVFICKVRKKLALAGAGRSLIETVWGGGYLMRDPGRRSAVGSGLMTLAARSAGAALLRRRQHRVTSLMQGPARIVPKLAGALPEAAPEPVAERAHAGESQFFGDLLDRALGLEPNRPAAISRADRIDQGRERGVAGRQPAGAEDATVDREFVGHLLDGAAASGQGHGDLAADPLAEAARATLCHLFQQAQRLPGHGRVGGRSGLVRSAAADDDSPRNSR